MNNTLLESYLDNTILNEQVILESVEKLVKNESKLNKVFVKLKSNLNTSLPEIYKKAPGIKNIINSATQEGKNIGSKYRKLAVNQAQGVPSLNKSLISDIKRSILKYNKLAEDEVEKNKISFGTYVKAFLLYLALAIAFSIIAGILGSLILIGSSVYSIWGLLVFAYLNILFPRFVFKIREYLKDEDTKKALGKITLFFSALSLFFTIVSSVISFAIFGTEFVLSAIIKILSAYISYYFARKGVEQDNKEKNVSNLVTDKSFAVEMKSQLSGLINV